MIETLIFFATYALSGIAIIFLLLQFAVGEPTGKHSRYNPSAIPAAKFTNEGGAHREFKPVAVYTVNVP